MADPDQPPGAEGVDPSVFHDIYQGDAPWDLGEPQPEVVKLLEQHLFESPVLDVGCGTGENAVLLGMSGHDVTGVDLVPRAVEQAEELADDRHVEAHFEVGDALRLGERFEAGSFGTVLDSGVFHVFSDEDRSRYAQILTELVRPAGWLHVIVFAQDEPGGDGPRRVSRRELEATFADGWELVQMVPTRYGIRSREHGAKAWRGSWRRQGFHTR